MTLQYRFIKTAFTAPIKFTFEICGYLMKEDIKGYDVNIDTDFISIESIYWEDDKIECVLLLLDNGTYKVELYKANDDYEEILEPFFTSDILIAYKQFKAYYKHTQK